MSDIEFFFDPVCPYCWVTSQWFRKVQHQRDIDVDWRFISLAMLNEGSYEGKPELYPEAHRRGLEMLRVAAAARASHGPGVVGNFYEALGKAVWHADGSDVEEFDDVHARNAAGRDLAPVLQEVGLPADLADAAQDESWDDEIRSDTEEALRRVGGDLGTPIISFDPPDGPAFYGPVIREVPSDEDAVVLFDAISTLGRWPSFAELKRNIRRYPRTPLTANLAARERRRS